jgi:hypothetical protein
VTRSNPARVSGAVAPCFGRVTPAVPPPAHL